MLEARVDRLEAVFERIAAAQARTDEHLATLTARIDGLTEAQQRTELRLNQLAEAQQRTELRLNQLAEAQQRTELRLNQLAEAQQRTELRLNQLAEAQQRTELRLNQLAEAQQHAAVQIAELARALAQLTTRVDRLASVLGGVKGMVLEIRYRDRAPAYFDDMLRRIHALSAEELAELVDDAEERGAITNAERRDLLLADVVVRGRRRGDDTPAYLVAEVSSVVDEHDVWRAIRRAEELSRATGQLTIPAVAGEQVTRDAEDLARQHRVWCVRDGRVDPPSEPVA